MSKANTALATWSTVMCRSCSRLREAPVTARTAPRSSGLPKSSLLHYGLAVGRGQGEFLGRFLHRRDQLTSPKIAHRPLALGNDVAEVARLILLLLQGRVPLHLDQRAQHLRPNHQLPRGLLARHEEDACVVVETLVIPRGEDTHATSGVHSLIATAAFLGLVAAHHHVQVVAGAELARHVLAPRGDDVRMIVPRRPVDAEAILGLVRDRVGPEDVPEDGVRGQVVVGQRPLCPAQVVQVPVPGADAAVEDQDVPLEEAGQRHPIEDASHRHEDDLAHVGAETLLTTGGESRLAHEPVHLHVLVVAPHQHDAVRVHHLQGEEQYHHL
mmetsp:Transcript_88416/g.227985  ORF Transcript_88416/g.227985 Transcript_88416/m.227985 type:complete len:327 (+) Transcript_88416:281-1261(+)